MFDIVSSFIFEIIGAFIFGTLNGFKGKLSEQMSGPYDTNKKSLRNGITSIAVILLIIAILTSCSTKKETSISQFEEYIGETYSNMLDSMIIVFKHVVDQPIGSNDFEYFIKKTITDSLTRKDWLKNSIEAATIKSRIKESGLRNDIYFDIYKVEYIDGIVISTYKYWDIYHQDSITVIDSTFIFNPSKQIDTSLHRDEMLVPSDFNIQEYITKRKNHLAFNKHSRFYEGLRIHCKDTMIEEYLTFIEMTKWYNLVEFSKGLEHENPDYNNYFLQRIIALELFAKETLSDHKHTEVANFTLSTPFKPKLIVLPAYDKISNRGISPKIQKTIETQLQTSTEFILIDFPSKDLMHVPYQNVFDKRYCKPITDNINCDIIIMSKLELVKKTGNISTDLWNVRFKIYNVNSNKQIDSQIRIDSLSSSEITNNLEENRSNLLKEIKQMVTKL